MTKSGFVALLLTMTTRKEASPLQHRPAGFLPRIDAAGDMGGVGEARLLGGGNRHRGALAERAEEHDAAPGRRRHLAQHAARLQAFADRGVGRVQRARQRAVLGAFAVFPEVDQENIGTAEALDALAGAERYSLFGEILLMQAD